MPWDDLLLITMPLAFFILSATWAGIGVTDTYLHQKLYETSITILVVLLMPSLLSTKDDLKALQIFLLVGCGTLVILPFLKPITGAVGQTLGPQSDRLALLGGGPNVLARLAFTALAISMSIGLAQKKTWLLAFAILCGLVIVMTGSRGGMIAAAAMLGVWFLIKLPNTIWHTGESGRQLSTRESRQRWLLLGAIVAVIAAVVFLPAFESVRETFDQRVIRLTIIEEYTSGRDVLYQDALRIWSAHKFFGAGMASFSTANAVAVYPHNIFLEFLTETGLVGTAMFLACELLVAARIWRSKKNVDQAFLLIFVGYLVAAQFSGDLYDSRCIFIYELLCLISARVAKGPRLRSRSYSPVRPRMLQSRQPKGAFVREVDREG